MIPRLHSLADLATLFGPDAKAPVIKNGGTAEAGRREDNAMQPIHQNGGARHTQGAISPSVVRPADPVMSARLILENLSQRFERNGPFAVMVEITPDLANLLLDRNPDNRTPKAAQIETIARDIREGRWEANGETIVVSRDGDLNDGQHRLAACIVADMPIVTLLAYGMERETRQTIDSNQITRTPGDFLTMAGIEDGNNIAAIAAYLWQIERYGEIPKHATHSSRRPTKQQLQDYVGRKQASLALAAKVTSSAKAGRLYSKSLIAVALHHIRDALGVHVEGDQPSAFIDALLTGDNLNSDDPVFVVRNRLLDDKRRRRSDPRVAMELIIRAWNLRCKRQTIAKCLSTGELPAVETYQRSR
ncbi:hypothetical protein MKK88_05910 [Methylobacterium sp. E-005]|uniref:hypothetical protein n=1 Tax=Methylobacterium sp. E-005 TaxID=2836549 RepID=UPI001FBB8941|nr:hypothetical protein [Methylobacterium sp. E-005]MCJ2085530.1 hypothetical protein [Methylobacterium sp. E-005]